MLAGVGDKDEEEGSSWTGEGSDARLSSLHVSFAGSEGLLEVLFLHNFHLYLLEI